MSVRPPTSTYRLQFQAGFGFREAAAIADYLAALGVGDVYSSPFLRARPGSRHGYDICDPGRLNPELGTDADFGGLIAALAAHRLGHLADIVPNHMSIDPGGNAWWRDVLEHGAASPFAPMFDIDWTPLKTELGGKVLLPILGCQYGQALEQGDLHLALRDGALVLSVQGDGDLPINRASAEARGIAPEAAALAAINGRPGDPSSFDRLHDLLEAQAYRLASWRTSAHEINYRRFFDVDALAGVRVEIPEVFDATHALIGSLIGAGAITGLRVDHPDGLAQPAEYFARVQDLAADRLGRPRNGDVIYTVAEKILTPGETLPSAWRIHGTTGYPFLNTLNGLFVSASSARALTRVHAQFTGRREPFHDIAYRSKKLVMETALASELNVLAYALNRVSERNRRARDFTLNSLRRALREFIACLSVYRTYLTIRDREPADEDRIFAAIGQARRRNPELESTIFDFLADVVLDAGPASDDPARVRPARYPPVDDEDRAMRRRFTRKLQQYTGPVHAKGVEDTAFFRHTLLLSLNEVGGDPSTAGVPAAEFHRRNQARRETWPLEMLATATHDTKLGEDVRARLNVLSEVPDRWRAALGQWSRINALHRTRVDGHWFPDRNDEYRFYQALLGVWPPESVDAAADASSRRDVAAALRPRLERYMMKAAKEAKIHTSWINEHAAYDQAVAAFVGGVLEGRTTDRFFSAFVPMARDIARAGMINALAQTILKIGSPGVPDVYQGTELWDLHLVDPDNRGLVDYDLRRRHLASLEEVFCAVSSGRTAEAALALRHLLEGWPDGRIKLFVTATGLRVRREMADVFLDGAYLPLDTETASGASAIAFAREGAGRLIIVAAAYLAATVTIHRAVWPIGDAWADDRVHLPEAWAGRTFRNAFSGGTVVVSSEAGRPGLRCADLFADLPIALWTHVA